ncbi:unnamed protein product [Cyclocybe aegerita]|uniref:Uncharacterized protein n=1 Tax=Cyclocybe aegerita TaxID=1973307 RepID=A0A8S0WUW3_CYCAE|nr:unnamed protein product [Cyclocybe aegerita]
MKAIEWKLNHRNFERAISGTLLDRHPPELDAAREDLYNFGVSRITKEEASHLVNYTYRLPGDEDHYVIELDVFHQPHCLNMLRKAINADYYPETNHFDAKHWSHCIESIRQSLICSADVMPSCGSG